VRLHSVGEHDEKQFAFAEERRVDSLIDNIVFFSSKTIFGCGKTEMKEFSKIFNWFGFVHSYLCSRAIEICCFHFFLYCDQEYAMNLFTRIKTHSVAHTLKNNGFKYCIGICLRIFRTVVL